jgi:hypothetical protein
VVTGIPRNPSDVASPDPTVNVPPKRRRPPALPVGLRKPTLAPPRRPTRAIFVDVENTSNENTLLPVLASLNIDFGAQPTEVRAIGNWKSVGQRLGYRLAGMGAKLVHSAPVSGVKDWSDLWIAVAAGFWLGKAAPGDTLEIVSDDRAFDAVGDAAASLGVTFRRVTCRSIGRSVSAAMR